MEIPDVNVLVAAVRSVHPHHVPARDWLERHRQSDASVLLPGVVVSGFLRVATNARIFGQADHETVLGFLDSLLAERWVMLASPSSLHVSTFIEICRQINATGNTVSDAYLAAIAIDLDCEFVTFDRGFARFPGLKWTLLRG
ncbi:MAG: PIN domain-containing protein [Dehalococcoidia bacterium]|nr:PIN domain-containing protein [Dehalococcoidia bacterium]